MRFQNCYPRMLVPGHKHATESGACSKRRPYRRGLDRPLARHLRPLPAPRWMVLLLLMPGPLLIDLPQPGRLRTVPLRKTQPLLVRLPVLLLPAQPLRPDQGLVVRSCSVSWQRSWWALWLKCGGYRLNRRRTAAASGKKEGPCGGGEQGGCDAGDSHDDLLDGGSSRAVPGRGVGPRDYRSGRLSTFRSELRPASSHTLRLSERPAGAATRSGKACR